MPCCASQQNSAADGGDGSRLGHPGDVRCTTALPPKADVHPRSCYVAFVQILLQKSPRRSCRIKIRNNRIGANGSLNQRRALGLILNQVLRARMSKNVFRQYRSKCERLTASTCCLVFSQLRTLSSEVGAWYLDLCYLCAV